MAYTRGNRGATRTKQPKPKENRNMDLKKLFSAAQKAEEAYEKAQEALDMANEKRSEAVKAFAEAAGNNGPFETPDGRIVTIRNRTTYAKDSDGNKTNRVLSDTWFFVGQGERTIQKI